MPRRTKFRSRCRPAGGTYSQIASVGTNVVSYSDTGLSNGTAYYYRVRATNSIGNSGYSNEANATTLSLPAAPSGLGATAAGLQANLTWTDNSGNETGFLLERKTGVGGTYGQIASLGANVTSYSDPGLSPSTTYYYRVRATNTVGDSGYSTEASMTTLALPTAPTGLGSSAASSSQVNLTWTDTSNNESGFKVERKTGAGGTYSQIATPAANATSYSDTTVTSGNTYYYRVRATNAAGDSTYSNETSINFAVPAAPSSLGATTVSSTQIDLSWTDNSNNESGFKLERKTGVNGTYAQIATPSANATTYSDTGLSTGTTYYYRIRSTSAVGDSAYSNEAHATAFPSQPSDVTGSQTLTFEYDPFGNLTKTTDGAGNQTVLTYDLRGRKTAMSDPDMGNWSYVYDAAGQLIRQTDAKTNVSTMTYDALGRMTGRNEGDLTSSWTYDNCTKGVGKLCSVSASNGYARSYTYDSLGRPSSLGMTVDVAYTTTTTYDTSGRVSGVTYPTGQFAVTYVYTTTGYLSEVRNAADNSVLWHASQLSASGQVLSETLGNNLVTTRGFDALDRLTSIQSGSGTGTVHQQSYTYDSIGNLTQRIDQVQSVTENFAYDNLNRLTAVSGPSLTTRTFSYDAIGNITYKSDVGAYTYPASGVSSVRPHAVSGVSGFINSSYTYDANGNLTVGNGKTLTYASFNLPNTVSATGYSYTYTYSAEHERVRLVTVRPDDTLTTIYVHPNGGGSLLYEKETKQSTGEVENKFYVSAGKELVGVYVINNTVSEMRYYHRDHLGSVAVITNPAGAVLERLAYEAFGERRNPNGTPQDRASPIIGITTDRGFTTHEHLDELNLIHMNGRIYDPALGRFMTADSLLQFPANLQSYNRYSYILNNPLAGTDPTGHVIGIDDVIIGSLIAGALFEATGHHDLAKVAFGVAAGAFFGPALAPFGTTTGALGAFAPIANGVVGGFAGGLVSSGGSFNAAVHGAVTGGLFGWAGTVTPGMDSSFERYAAHALAGCIGGELDGGSCGRGAVSAVAGKFATNITEGNFVASVIAGGTVSVALGGKFANGAYTAAFGYLFNQAMSDKNGRAPNDRALIAENRARVDLEAEGYKFVGRQMEASIEGLPVRRYDLVMLSPDGIVTGIEVKSTIVDSFKLNPQQVAFDVSVYTQGGATLRDITTSVKQVMYYGVGFGPTVGAAFQNRVLKSYLDRVGIQTRTKTGVSLP